MKIFFKVTSLMLFISSVLLSDDKIREVIRSTSILKSPNHSVSRDLLEDVYKKRSTNKIFDIGSKVFEKSDFSLYMSLSRVNKIGLKYSF
jgi:hypothetical protein